MAASDLYEISRSDAVAELRLVRAEENNPFDEDLVRALPGALTGLAEDTAVRAVVLSSAGRHFSAGGDFETMLRGHDDLAYLMRGVDDGRRLFRAFADFPKPLVVALHGHVFGVGTSLILTADAVVATPTALLSDPHVRMGLVAGDGGTIGWPAHAGLLRAKRQLLWGEPLTGADAHRLGLVTELAETPDEVRSTALELAAAVAALPPVAVQLTKRLLNRSLQARTDELLDVGFYLEALSNRTDDVVEAVTAFKEKREGRWTGR